MHRTSHLTLHGLTARLQAYSQTPQGTASGSQGNRRRRPGDREARRVKASFESEWSPDAGTSRALPARRSRRPSAERTASLVLHLPSDGRAALDVPPARESVRRPASVLTACLALTQAMCGIVLGTRRVSPTRCIRRLDNWSKSPVRAWRRPTTSSRDRSSTWNGVATTSLTGTSFRSRTSSSRRDRGREGPRYDWSGGHRIRRFHSACRQARAPMSMAKMDTTRIRMKAVADMTHPHHMAPRHTAHRVL